MASHQLRTPLATVNWYVEMLMDGDAGDLNEDQVEYLREISLGNQRMIDMVDSLLNVSRIDLGRFNMNSTRINVAETLSHITHELQPQLNSKDLKIKTVLKKRAAYIEGDKSLMRNVFLNLLSNAIKYSHENGTIEARVEQHKS